MRSWGRAALLVALVAGLLGAPGAGPATAAGADPERREELQDQLQEFTTTEARLAEELEALQEERDRLAAELAAVEQRVADAEAAVEAAVVVEGQATARAAAAESELRRTSTRLARNVRRLQDQAVSAFMSGGATAELNGLLEVGDIQELETAQAYSNAVVAHQDAVVDEVERLKEQVEELADRAERARAAAVEAAHDAEVRRDALRAERDDVASLRGDADAAAARQAAFLDQVRLQRASVEAELAALQAVSSSISAWLATAQSGQVAVAPTRGMLLLPVPSARVSSSFGPRVHPIFGDVRVHTGVDFAAPNGTPIAAAGAGVVVVAGPQGGYGNVVVIDHGNALATMYAHQSRVAVVVGQRVAAGETIGAVGSTGNSTGPHGHFEVRVSGTPVDPLAYL